MTEESVRNSANVGNHILRVRYYAHAHRLRAKYYVYSQYNTHVHHVALVSCLAANSSLTSVSISPKRFFPGGENEISSIISYVAENPKFTSLTTVTLPSVHEDILPTAEYNKTRRSWTRCLTYIHVYYKLDSSQFTSIQHNSSDEGVPGCPDAEKPCFPGLHSIH